LYSAVAAPAVENATAFGYEYKGNAVVDELPENESAINGTDVVVLPMIAICLFSSF
jgi:hypothetical protein